MYQYMCSNFAQNVGFSSFFFFHIFLPNSTLYFIHTSKPLQIHLEISILLNSSFITYVSSKTFPELFPNNSNMGYNPYTTQTLTRPDPDTLPGFPGWSRLVEFHCTIPRECTKGPPPKREINTCSTTIPYVYRKSHDRPIQM